MGTATNRRYYNVMRSSACHGKLLLRHGRGGTRRTGWWNSSPGAQTNFARRACPAEVGNVMFKAIKTLFDELGGETTVRETNVQRRDLRDAVAGLLHEMIRSDLKERPEEKVAAAAGMRALFALSEAESRALVEEAGDRARRFTSYFGPVSLIKRHYGQPERIALVEHLWRIAYADGGLDPHEDHFVRKIANLLYVSNTDAMLARARARPAR
jgi:uncharacterized tellurite resistance protein B-like protein